MRDTEYIVAGRRFKKRLHAVTYAQQLAAEQDQSVDVELDVINNIVQRRRTWICRMHPPGRRADVTVKQPLPAVRAVNG